LSHFVIFMFCHFPILRLSFFRSFVLLFFRPPFDDIQKSFAILNSQFNEDHHLCVLIKNISGLMWIDEKKLWDNFVTSQTHSIILCSFHNRKTDIHLRVDRQDCTVKFETCWTVREMRRDPTIETATCQKGRWILMTDIMW
jgi:hypothetical protein